MGIWIDFFVTNTQSEKINAEAPKDKKKKK
jgi:hypothetical protein